VFLRFSQLFFHSRLALQAGRAIVTVRHRTTPMGNIGDMVVNYADAKRRFAITLTVLGNNHFQTAEQKPAVCHEAARRGREAQQAWVDGQFDFEHKGWQYSPNG
jgi:hypothetical protein